MKFKLMQLLHDNRIAGKTMQSKVVAAADSDEAVIYLYDPIVGDRMTAEYFGCVCAQDLVPQIAELKAKTIHLRINCPGGDVFAMQSIMNALRNQSAKIIAYVDGVAASAATGIAAVCDEVVMEKGSLFMIHNSQGLCYGDKNEMAAMQTLMGKVDEGMVDAYVKKTGASSEKIIAYMDAETWFTADEAVTAGFANSVNEGKKPSVDAETKWNLSAFANAPKDEKQPVKPEPKVISDEHRERQQQRVRMMACRN